MVLNKKVLGVILGAGAIGGGSIALYRYLNKTDIVQEKPTKEVLDKVAKNRAWAKNKFSSKWKSEYDNLDFGLDLTQKA